MKLKRIKKYKKDVNFYQQTFGFRAPFQVIVDGTVVHSMNQSNLNIENYITNTIGGPLKLFTTPCILKELKSLGPEFMGSLNSAGRNLEKRKCRHNEEPKSGNDCIRDLVGESNKHRYFVATQDKGLRRKLARIPGCPLIYVNNGVMILEPPSISSLEYAKSIEKQKLLPCAFELPESSNEKKIDVISLRRKSRVKKGVNPLSCKKKLKKNLSKQTMKQDVPIGDTNS